VQAPLKRRLQQTAIINFVYALSIRRIPPVSHTAKYIGGILYKYFVGDKRYQLSIEQEEDVVEEEDDETQATAAHPIVGN